PVDDIVEAVEQPRDRGLAGARRTDNGGGLAGRHLETDALEDGPVGIVVEPDVVEAHDRSADDQWLRPRTVLDLRVLVEEPEHRLNVGKALANFAIDET